MHSHILCMADRKVTRSGFDTISWRGWRKGEKSQWAKRLFGIGRDDQIHTVWPEIMIILWLLVITWPSLPLSLSPILMLLQTKSFTTTLDAYNTIKAFTGRWKSFESQRKRHPLMHISVWVRAPNFVCGHSRIVSLAWKFLESHAGNSSMLTSLAFHWKRPTAILHGHLLATESEKMDIINMVWGLLFFLLSYLKIWLFHHKPAVVSNLLVGLMCAWSWNNVTFLWFCGSYLFRHQSEWD